MRSATIGLVDRNPNSDRVASDLHAAGWICQEIGIGASGDAHAIWKQLSCHVHGGALSSACVGAVLTGGFFAVLGISAAHCGSMSGFSLTWSAGTAVLFPVTGLGLGALIGAVVSEPPRRAS